MDGPRLACASLLLAMLAGCSDGGSTPDVDPTADLGLVATDTTGIVRGVVVDEAIRPIADVKIELAALGGVQTTTSNADGAFGFQGLSPGAYLLKASKLGYFGAQQATDVVAGEAEPPIVKLQMSLDVANIPYYQAQVFEGFVECTTSVLVTCGAPNLVLSLWCQGELDPVPPMCVAGNVTNDRYTNDFYFADNATHIQFEMAWESNQAASPEMYFEMEELNGDCEAPAEDGPYADVRAYNNTHGPSPIYATVNETQIAAWRIGTACPIYFSVFSGGVPGAPCDPLVTGWCAGVTVEQRFRLFVHDFHGYMPPVGWRFVLDGDPPLPV